jgi:hypothetical protein
MRRPRVMGFGPGRYLDGSGQGVQIARPCPQPPPTDTNVYLLTDRNVCPPLWERGLPEASLT